MILLDQWVENELSCIEPGIFIADHSTSIDYSDGRSVEKYLSYVFSKEKDLSSDSKSLEHWIKDWSSEYHLSRRRAQLLSGFSFDKKASVLEVGCGCGAITRFLGETFENVIGIEGTRERAMLAKKRCRGLDSVQIICSPFHQVKFKKQFDLIFCIGVFEYSSYFVSHKDPYTWILKYFQKHLNPGGQLILALENQFGLKYFASATEDHSGVRYDGLEGYHRGKGKARTFGHDELEKMLTPFFSDLKFYYPYPDYKLVDTLISDAALATFDISNLMDGLTSRDYLRPYGPVFNESLVLKEIIKNKKLPFFSNSFLILATNEIEENQKSMDMKSLALVFNRNRAEAYQTRMEIYKEGETLWVSKTLLNNEKALIHHRLPYIEPWVEGVCLGDQILKRAQNKKASLSFIFEPVKIWAHFLESKTDSLGYLPGHYVDAIWQNTLIRDNQLSFIDLEWDFQQRLSFKVLFIRGVYRFLVKCREQGLMAGALKFKTTKDIIQEVALLMDVQVYSKDLTAFIEMETRIQIQVSLKKKAKGHIQMIFITPQQILIWICKGLRIWKNFNFYLSKLYRILDKKIRE